MRVVRKASGFVLLIGLASSALHAAAPVSPGGVRLDEGYALRPLAFEENRGQTDGRVRFLARGAGYGLFLAVDEAVLALGRGASGRVLRLRWAGANPAPRVAGEGELPGRSHYLIGGDPAGWHAGIPSYGRVRYGQVYPGVDLVFYGRQRQLEHDFILAPGADPERIRLEVLGADRLEIDAAGDLVLACGGEEVRLRRPLSYQEIGGVRREVTSGWRRLPDDGAARVGFRLGAYDATRPLVIDPVLAYSTYLGGSSDDWANSVAVDAAGNAYVTGMTRSADFPTLGSALRPNPAEAFVAKLGPGGTLVYSTYLGGRNSIEEGHGIAVDASGHAFVTGVTSSDDFPLVNPIPAQFRGEGGEVFIAKLHPGGASLVYSTTLGGVFDTEEGTGIALDAAGNAFVTGFTLSPDFPALNALYPTDRDGFPDAFVAKLSAAGALLFSTFLGGSSLDEARDVAVDAAGFAVVTGTTESTDFPTVDAQQGSQGGESDGFVVKLHPSGASLAWSTYLGGSQRDESWAVDVDAAGSSYLTGITASPEFPLVNPLQPVLHTADAFVTKLDAEGSIVYSTYLGGSRGALGLGIAVDRAGSAHVAGFTNSADFPLKDPVLARCEPREDGFCFENAFVTKLTPAGNEIVYSTYLGGDRELAIDRAWEIDVDARGDAYVVGWTSATDFPVANAIQPFLGGGLDAFVARIAAANQPPACAAAAASPATLWPPNGKLVPIEIRGVTDPDGDPLTLAVTAIQQDEATGRRGPDAAGIGSAAAQVRADRAGGGDGRVYRLTFTATDGKGGTCAGTVQVCVPHDQGRRRTCGDGGALFDSTAPVR